MEPRKPFFRWRVEKMCENCPFMEDGDGYALRQSLSPGRWDEIVRGIMAGQRFPCHKTTRETGNGTDLYCAGALERQALHKIETDYMRLCRSLEGVQESKATMFKRLRRIFKERR